MSRGSPELDPPSSDALEVARGLVVERNLVPVAFEHLTRDAFAALPFGAVGQTKVLINRFFSTDPWTNTEVAALAEVAGPGDGWWSWPLDQEITLEYGWRDGRFTLTLEVHVLQPPASADESAEAAFYGRVVPEPTSDPRTMRFRSGPINNGESQWYELQAAGQGFWRASRLFDQFPEIADVRLGADFLEVSLRRASDWERLLGPMQPALADVLTGAAPAVELRWIEETATERPARKVAANSRTRRLAEAWAELGPLQATDPRDLGTVIIASYGEDPFRRQVAANLLLMADSAIAANHWERLLSDDSRAVRRATVDAMADAGREELRPLLERALGDDDGWVRWKALRGLVELGPEPSRDAIAALARDRDFRVRLEVANFLDRAVPDE